MLAATTDIAKLTIQPNVKFLVYTPLLIIYPTFRRRHCAIALARQTFSKPTVHLTNILGLDRVAPVCAPPPSLYKLGKDRSSKGKIVIRQRTLLRSFRQSGAAVFCLLFYGRACINA